ncbi:MAG TPA: DUF4388 domain-containing protein [Streptosporangiaceae bacterium]
MLESLGRKRTSGVLEVDGNPAGAIYLDRGQITFARASWAPDLTARLCGVLQPAPELRNLLRGSDQADRDIGGMLVERGFMARNELQSILRSAMVDALLALTTPLAGGSSVSDIRFEAPGVHWAAAFVRLPLETVQAEVARRAEQMSRAGVADTVPIALADFDRGPAILTREQWAIACRVNGSLTPRDLARQAGLPLYDTITALGILLRRGLCTLATPIPSPPRGGTSPDSRPSRAQEPRLSGLPDPRPSVTLIPPPSAPAPRRPQEVASSAPASDSAAPAPRAESPATRLPGAKPTLAGPLNGRAPGPADSPARGMPGPSDIPRPPAPRAPSRPDPAPVSRSAQAGAPTTRNFPPPGPRYPGDLPPAAGARAPRGAPSPSWVPAPDELLAQADTGPQANLAAPRDVPRWNDAPMVRDPGSSRPARDGLTWGAHRGPTGSPPPGPADRPEPLPTRSGPAPIPADPGVPPVRRQPSFTPIVAPTPLASPELASPPPPVPSPVAEEPVPSGAAPTAVVPPAPTDVPIVRPSRRLPPAHPGYRRPPRPEWSTAAPPVPSAVLAAPAAIDSGPAAMDSGPAARPPDPDDPAGAWRPLLPRREPGAGLVQPPRNSVATMPIPAGDWHSPEPAEAAESEAFAATGPDLLRRVLDGLRRLT